MSVTTKPEAETPATEPAKRSKRTLVLATVVVLVVVGAAAYWFLLRGSSAPEPPEEGEVVALEPVQVNLSGGHYLRVGVALQMTADATEADGSKALDSTIALFTGREVDELADEKKRSELQAELEEELHESYEGQVLHVYFTEFVTQ